LSDMSDSENDSGSTRFRRLGWFNTKELALISIFSSLWIVLEIYFGPFISQVTQVHGVIQRVFGWFLMLVLAALTGKFGRVTTMAAIASAATRIIRPGRLYSLFVGLGYAFGGLTFDLLYFLPWIRNHKEKTGKTYLLAISALSGTVALIPYVLFNLSVMGLSGFLIWIPLYTYDMIKSVVLSILGTLIGMSVLPRVAVFALKVKDVEVKTDGVIEDAWVESHSAPHS